MVGDEADLHRQGEREGGRGAPQQPTPVGLSRHRRRRGGRGACAVLRVSTIGLLAQVRRSAVAQHHCDQRHQHDGPDGARGCQAAAEPELRHG